ncbi:MAG: tripartite tricarboxylate transporter substrate binding protein [Deltaproteobacteria bacterium HGW-Deltaproteobacteria-15]|jgi:tripartite-type tricarboxylate transporter receptor subunit TctC|nr:MAG: tripartite tricarboxylate transporter substrate binding protein [Deltaproteobacteria bacterium HGW-Deltaproteobacteria-15]
MKPQLQKGGLQMITKIGIILVMLFFVTTVPIQAAGFPEKEVQIIIPWAAGGATDLIFRALATTTGKHLGKAVIIVNKPGGGGAVGYTEGMKAAPDGYTLTSAVTPLTILPHQVSTTFTYKNFDAIINVVDDPSMFLVRSDAAWKSFKDFLEYARKNPDTVTVGNSGAGGGVHLVALAFEHAAGAKFNHIPFSGGGPSVTALLGGHVNAVSVSPPEGISHVQAGKLRIIALFADKRFSMFPDVPTVKEQGVNFAMGMWRGLIAPKGTPPDVIKKLHDGFKKGMEDPAFAQKAKDMAVNVSYQGPADFGERIAHDHEFFGKLVKEIKK